ncbi:MAG: glycosyltransferase [Lachnospiraceae bacterium]|nr:glycosyltransferase [Lachnospiraceae bacterium]
MTVSVCMIVKNEEKVLARCLDSIADLAEEIIIVDTGSVDKTKEIAGRYTDKIYDFQWINDFSAARNYAFSLASMDYIYSADADEVLDGENRERFRILKDNLLPEIEIVQMKYGNQLENGTVYNFDEEYRPKLFKRLRTFTWIEPVHETVRLDPVVFDSDIVITHKPMENHGGRDIAIFTERLEKGYALSNRLWEMYARELFISGTDEELDKSEKYFRAFEEEVTDPELHKVICTVVARVARLRNDADVFFKYAMKLIAGGDGCSEICFELGAWYENRGDLNEAGLWFYNAYHETQPIIKLSCGGKEPLEHMAVIYERLGDSEQALYYRRMADELGK